LSGSVKEWRDKEVKALITTPNIIQTFAVNKKYKHSVSEKSSGIEFHDGIKAGPFPSI
jgi:hypothetical protein